MPAVTRDRDAPVMRTEAIAAGLAIAPSYNDGGDFSIRNSLSAMEPDRTGSPHNGHFHLQLTNRLRHGIVRETALQNALRNPCHE